MKDYKKENKELKQKIKDTEAGKEYYFKLWKEEKVKNDRIKLNINDNTNTEMCLQATQIQLATYKGMVDIYERITDTKEITENLNH